MWGEDVARTYDEDSAWMSTPEVLGPTLDVLADLAGSDRALEFAVGTGRVALPLAARGIPVSGVELSVPMLDRLRAKDGADALDLVEGDMARTRVDGEFTLVYLVYNTITNLLEQDEQVACFVNAARHLVPGGFFLIEVFVPDLQRLPPGETARPFHLSADHLGFDSYDLVNSRLTSHHYRPGRGTVVESHHRYAWPAEYDLMARIAGLEPHARWAGWDRSEFTADSRSHVSVWRRPT
ncbi:methyltransferase family protein [Kineococcus rhizosphaerae]|uniref:Methyltransferase family protein n=2 Tax=Kineococcus rhizosphaerae TaxID=559628 RepID=A0A2T0R5J0_9ACTN|nr:methyltransferase family protein [Kineococcus rhizosphaerae]